MERIIDLELKELLSRTDRLGYKVEITDEAKRTLAAIGYQRKYGVRALRRTLLERIEEPLSGLIIDGKLHNIVFTNGCNGNLKAIGSLLEGADPKFAIERLSGICCGFKNTSCGDQLARAIRQAVGE